MKLITIPKTVFGEKFVLGTDSEGFSFIGNGSFMIRREVLTKKTQQEFAACCQTEAVHELPESMLEDLLTPFMARNHLLELTPASFAIQHSRQHSRGFLERWFFVGRDDSQVALAMNAAYVDPLIKAGARFAVPTRHTRYKGTSPVGVYGQRLEDGPIGAVMPLSGIYEPTCISVWRYQWDKPRTKK